MLQLIYELRKNCCGTGRVDGTGRDGEIEGSTRGPRGPKKAIEPFRFLVLKRKKARPFQFSAPKENCVQPSNLQY